MFFVFLVESLPLFNQFNHQLFYLAQNFQLQFFELNKHNINESLDEMQRTKSQQTVLQYYPCYLPACG